MKIAHELAFAMIGGTNAGQAVAGSRSDVEVTFFKERALQNEVWWRTLSCGTGGVHTRGRVTPFYVGTQSTCPSGPHSNATSVSCHFTTAGCSADLNRMFAGNPPNIPKHRRKKPHKCG